MEEPPVESHRVKNQIGDFNRKGVTYLNGFVNNDAMDIVVETPSPPPKPSAPLVPVPKDVLYNALVNLKAQLEILEQNLKSKGQRMDKNEKEKIESCIQMSRSILNFRQCPLDEIMSTTETVRMYNVNMSDLFIDKSDKPTPLQVNSPPPQTQEAIVHTVTINHSVLRILNHDIKSAFEPTLEINLNKFWKILMEQPCDLCREFNTCQSQLLEGVNEENDKQKRVVLYFVIFCLTLRLVLTRYPQAFESLPKVPLIQILLTHSHLVESTLISDIIILIVNNDATDDDDLKHLIVTPLVTLLTEPIVGLSSLDMATFILGSILLPTKGDPSPVSKHAVECIEQNVLKFNYGIIGREPFLQLFLPFLSSKLLQKGVAGQSIYYLSRWVSSLVKSKFSTLNKRMSKFYLIQIISKLVQFSQSEITKALVPALGEIHQCCTNNDFEKFTIFLTEYFSTLVKLVETEQIYVFKDLEVYGFNEAWLCNRIYDNKNQNQLPKIKFNPHMAACIKKLLLIMSNRKVLTNILPNISPALVKILIEEKNKRQWINPKEERKD